MNSLGLLNEERIRSGNQNKPLINFSRGIIIPNADNVTKYAEELARTYAQNCDLKEKKSKGQFFTSKEIGLFMASMFEINKTSFNILDPGAGIGMLSASLSEFLLKSKKDLNISLDTYENDAKLIPHLDNVLKKCKSVLENKGHIFNYKIIEKDFILNNPNYLMETNLFSGENQPVYYDYVISNPPYYKLNKNSPYCQLMSEFISGQPNIYSFFMALSLKMLKKDGQMVFITPRSFCSGLYFKKFRKWLLGRGNINNIHIFESRSDVFAKEKVLQENIIIRLTPKNKKQEVATITKSKDSSFIDLGMLQIKYKDIFHKKNGDIFIKVPSSALDIKIQHIINSWKFTLNDLGLRVSTGPVVSFRATEFLSSQYLDDKAIVPLLWMHNIKGMNTVWPVHNLKKHPAIRVCAGSKSLLVPLNNYVLVKRFTSKEQRRRVQAGVLLKSKFGFGQIGMENHLNYIYKDKGELSIEEAYGIAGILNTSIIDIFFRMLNGSTQVNAVDIENLPLPSLENIKSIGKAVIKSNINIGRELDETALQILGINSRILKEAYS